ncbi:hypothetical protein [Nostoc sp.]
MTARKADSGCFIYFVGQAMSTTGCAYAAWSKVALNIQERGIYSQTFTP